MIKLLDHKNASISKAVLSISLQAYQIEAEQIGASDFPPLSEKVGDIKNSPNLFYGFVEDGQIVGVQEIEREDNGWLIARLVVAPRFFRQGIASKLVAHAVNNFQPCRVSTAVNNFPAIALYERLGFIQSPVTHAVTPEITIVSLTYCNE